MSEIDTRIRKELKKIGSENGPAQLHEVTVTDVNLPENTCTVLFSTGLEIDGVRIKALATSGNDYYLVIPASGSKGIVSDLGGHFNLIQVDQVQDVKWKIGTLEFSASEKFLLKKGTDTFGAILMAMLDAMLAEVHIIPGGATTGLNPATIAAYNSVKSRLNLMML